MNSKEAVASLNKQAGELWDNGQYDEALEQWRAAYELDPFHLDTLVNLSWALSYTGDAINALPLAERALALAPGDWRTHHTLGHAHYQAGHYGEAANSYRKALSSGCSDPGVYCDLADARYSEGHFAEAAKAYAAFVERAPDDAYGHLWLGWSLYQVGEDTVAAHHFEEALNLEPDWPEALYATGQACSARGEFLRAHRLLEFAFDRYPEEDEEGRAATACELGNALRGLGRLGEAVRSYEHALSLDPTHLTARFNLGLALLDLACYEEAVVQFDIVTRFEPEDADAYLEKAEGLLAQELYDQAVSAYRAALEIAPGLTEALGGLGLTYYMLGLYDLAVQQYESAALLTPGDAWAHYNLGLAQEAAGRLEEADRSFQAALEHGEHDTELCISLSRVLSAHARNLEEALWAAQRALEQEPTNPAAFDALAYAHYAAGQYERALALAQEAVSLAPEEADFHFNLGLIYEALGIIPQSLESYRLALKFAPDFEEAHDALRRLGEDLP